MLEFYIDKLCAVWQLHMDKVCDRKPILILITTHD